MSTSYSPCAACKCLRRKCTNECVFAPYFPPDNPQKFTNVHKVFGASNVAKLLNELNANQREDAVNSLAYEAEYRLRDPVYGCVGLVSILQHKLRQIQHDLELAKKELATYIGPSAMLPMLNHPGIMQPQQQQQQNFNPSPVYQMMPYHVQQMMFPMGAPRGGQMMIREPQQQHQQQQQQQQQQQLLHQHQQMLQQQQLLQQQQQQQQILEAQQLAALAAAREQQEMLRVYEQQQLHQQLQEQQNDLMRFNDGFDDAATGGPVTATGFNQMPEAAAATAQDALEPSLALGGSYDTQPYQHIEQQTHGGDEQSHNSQSHSHNPHELQLQQHEFFLQQEQQQLISTHHHLQQALQQYAQAPQASHSHLQTEREKSDDGRSIGP